MQAAERVSQIQVAHSDRDALQAIVDDLLELRLIACGQLLGPVRSSYRWEGALHHEEEWLALLKTAHAAVPDVLARVRELHGYEIPEILATDAADGHPAYLRWVLEQTGQGRG